MPEGRPGIFLEFSQIACRSFSLALLFALTAHLLFTLRWRVPFHIREFVQRDVDVVVARGQSVVKFLTFVVTFSLVLPN